MEQKKTLQEYFDMQEKDRQRIARDLHDFSLQNLTHIIQQIELSILYMDVDKERSKLELSDVECEIKNIIQDIRDTIFELRPMTIDDLGLRDTILQLLKKLQDRHKIQINSDICDDLDNYLLKNNTIENIKLDIYRIVQELVNNSIKHSHGTKIDVIISCDDIIKIIVKDDGIGFNKNREDEKQPVCCNHYGINLLKARLKIYNGSFEVNSTEDCGTIISIQIPINVG